MGYHIDTLLIFENQNVSFSSYCNVIIPKMKRTSKKLSGYDWGLVVHMKLNSKGPFVYVEYYIKIKYIRTHD